MIDYFTMSNNVFIKNKKSMEKEFLCYEYNGELVCEFCVVKLTNEDIEFSIIVIKNKFLIEAINIFSEMLYFKGNKKKNISINLTGNYNIDLTTIGFVYLNQKYIKLVKKFEEERINKFSSINELYSYPHLVPWNLVNREWDVIRIVQELVGKEHKILEIGSGYGKNLLLLKDLGYKNVKGIEYSENAVKIASKFTNINNTCESILNCSFDNDEFDAIIDIGCLHCIDAGDKLAAVRQVSRILKKNGLIISRYFLPKDKDWLERYPINVKSFGNTLEEINGFMSTFFSIEKSFCDDNCVYIVGRVKK